jgi:hypothetical protein
MPNWNVTINGQNATPRVNWYANSYGNGLEDMTVYTSSSTTANPVYMGLTYASWVKGVRFVGSSPDASPIFLGGSLGVVAKNNLIFNNYWFANYLLDNSVNSSFQMEGATDNLVLNNIETAGTGYLGFGSNEGNVLAYNYNRDAHTDFYENALFEHHAGTAFELDEGNEIGKWLEDDIHGTHTLSTAFRNYVSGGDLPLTTCMGACLPVAMEADAYTRFDNLIGNSLGSSQVTTYQSSSGLAPAVFLINTNNVGQNDPLVAMSLMRWGNCDTVTGTCRFQGSEVPTSIAPNSSCTASGIPYSCCTGSTTGSCNTASTWQNSVPSNNNLPCSFFMAGYTSTTCTPHSSGGTGLSWWQVCKTWTTFPTACATTQTQPFPPIGPDVTGGPYVNGTAYDIPAAVAFQNLPIDTSYQKSFSITGSSWSSGIETLTVGGIPSGSIHIMGPMQISGGNCATSGAGTSTGAEVYITASNVSEGTVSYARESNPGSCTGAMLFPDVRQFDERVYENDPVGTPPPQAPPAPTGLQVVVH